MREFSLLIGTETFHKVGTPHIMATITSGQALKREEEYKDVVGFYRCDDKKVNIKSFHKHMISWVEKLNKNMVLVFKQNKKSQGWLYFRNNNTIDFRKVQVYSNNDINYDIWLDPETNFWNPVDFLLEAEYFEQPATEAAEHKIINEKIDALAKQMKIFNTSILQLAETIKGII